MYMDSVDFCILLYFDCYSFFSSCYDFAFSDIKYDQNVVRNDLKFWFMSCVFRINILIGNPWVGLLFKVVHTREITKSTSYFCTQLGHFEVFEKTWFTLNPLRVPHTTPLILHQNLGCHLHLGNARAYAFRCKWLRNKKRTSKIAARTSC